MDKIGIPDFFSGRSVLITGATGFMGKVLVEKILRSCPEVTNVYVLMRPKRGQQVSTRLSELINTKIFDWLKKHNKDQLHKVVAVSGDITLPGLGLSSEDEELLINNVSVVFHAAATVKFDEAIKLSVAMNLIGTKKLLQLCEKMTKIESVVHVSTAYCNCDRDEIMEKIYPAPADPEQVMQMVNILGDDMLEVLTPKLLSQRPNTYTFTKALAEHVVKEYSQRLPIAIFRPSIVCSAWKEPLCGWVDNLNGPTGILAGAGKGILRSVICHSECIADLIPVDLAINCMLAVAWHTATGRPDQLKIYNCTSGATNPIYWGDVEKLGIKYMLKYPPKEMLWYPGGNFKKNRLLHNLHTFLLQTVPAYALDYLAKFSGKKPIMVKIQDKLQKTLKTTEFFTTREFRFNNSNTLDLYTKLRQEDKTIFNFDISSIEWNTYMESYYLGTRNYILKEELDTIPAARRSLKRLYWLHKSVQFLLIALSIWVMFLRTNSASSIIYRMTTFMFRTLKSISNLAIPGNI